MPRIFDNINLKLVSALKENIPHASRMDVSVGYFNLRGWRLLDRLVEELPEGDGGFPRCRLIACDGQMKRIWAGSRACTPTPHTKGLRQ